MASQVLACGFFVYGAEDLFKPRDMALRFRRGAFRGLLQIGRLRGFRHLRQRRKESSFRKVKSICLFNVS